MREEHPTWGPKKIRAYLLKHQLGLAVPCASTIGDVLKRNGVIVRKRRRRSVMPRGAPLRVAERPNDIWCADFKGEFRLGVGRYCYPLTTRGRRPWPLASGNSRIATPRSAPRCASSAFCMSQPDAISAASIASRPSAALLPFRTP